MGSENPLLLTSVDTLLGIQVKEQGIVVVKKRNIGTVKKEENWTKGIFISIVTLKKGTNNNVKRKVIVFDPIWTVLTGNHSIDVGIKNVSTWINNLFVNKDPGKVASTVKADFVYGRKVDFGLNEENEIED